MVVYMQLLARLNLLLLDTVLPDGDIWGGAVLAVVQENDPGVEISMMAMYCENCRLVLTCHLGPWTRRCKSRNP